MSVGLSDRPTAAPKRPRRRWVVIAAIAVLVAAVLAAGVTALVVSGRGGGPSPTPSASAPGVVVPAPSASAPQAPATGRTGGLSGSPVVPAFGWLPLWPFGSAADAAAWQRAASPGGHQPWHLSPDLTALAFTNGYLGFGTVDRSLGTTVRGDEAWVSVGSRADSGADLTAAVIHLARIGAGQDRPWEVVGSYDTTLTLSAPAYRDRIASPVAVAGRITGVDESLRVRVLGPDQTGVLGEVAGVPAGGDHQPWSVTVPFRAAAGTIRVVVVSTAGHAGPGVGRFAFVGVLTG